jgi:uncharacterized protein (TIGR00730 family)
METEPGQMPAERALWHREQRDLEPQLSFVREEFEAGFRLVAKIDRPAASVFGSARIGEGHPWYALARAVGRAFAREGWAVVTGGGPGLMEAANRGAKEAGGLSVGLGIQLPHEQGLNGWLDLSYDFKHFYARKVCFVKASEGFVTCPGGWGTSDELFEALVLIQTAKIHHFPVVLVGDGHWTSFRRWSELMVEEGTLTTADLEIVSYTSDPDEAAATVIACYKRQCRHVTNGADG